ALVSTSTSTSLIRGLPRFSFTQSVSTRTSGQAKAVMEISFLGPCALQQTRNVFDQVRGVLEDIVGEDHHPEPGPVAFDNPAVPFINQSRAGAGAQSFLLKQLHRPRVGELVVDLQDFIDKRRIE